MSDASPAGERLLVAGGIRYDKQPGTNAVNADLLASRTIEVSEEDRNWPYLNGAAQEARTVSGLWHEQEHVVSLTGIDAGEDSVCKQLEQSRFAHLATHGFFDKCGNSIPGMYYVTPRNRGVWVVKRIFIQPVSTIGFA